LPSDELFPSLFVAPFLLSRTLDELEVLVAELVEVAAVVYWREVTAGALALDDAMSSSSYSTVWISKPVLISCRLKGWKTTLGLDFEGASLSKGQVQAEDLRLAWCVTSKIDCAHVTTFLLIEGAHGHGEIAVCVVSL